MDVVLDVVSIVCFGVVVYVSLDCVDLWVVGWVLLWVLDLINDSVRYCFIDNNVIELDMCEFGVLLVQAKRVVVFIGDLYGAQW